MVGKESTLELEKSLKVFDCTKCGAPVQIRAQGMSVVCVCGSCKSVMDALDERHQVVSAAAKRHYRVQYIPLGARTKLKGHLWEVIGYMEKSDFNSYRWSEYLLFNPARGFRWITENEGHWNWILPIKKSDINVDAPLFNGHYYSLYHQGKALVINVTGEFYWRVAVDDVAHVKDFVRDNEILSYEKSENEISWTIGEYIGAEKIKEAFKIEKMPEQNGVAPNQPNAMNKYFKPIHSMWIFFIILIIVIQLAALMASQGTQVSRIFYSFKANEPIGISKEITTPEFTLNDEISNIEISLDGRVDNSWLYMAGSLINVDTGEAIEFDQGIEFYSGQDSDGFWSEGSHHADKILSNIPGGNYQLNFEVSGDKDADYKISVLRDVVIWGNILWALCLLCFIPLFMLWRKRSFEVQRWSQSDYSPYPHHHE
jgi:hypothetical protein